MKLSKRLRRFLAVVLVMVMSIPGMTQVTQVSAATTISQSTNDAISWLKARQDATQDKNLVDSFEGDNDWGVESPLVFTYDQACAAIAFSLAGDSDSIARAKRVLGALRSLQLSSELQNDPTRKGSWYNSYYAATRDFHGNPDSSMWYSVYNLQPQEYRCHVGVAMWVCMAVMAYEKATNDTTYHVMATDAIDWSLRFQKANGGIAGGRTTWDLKGPWSDEVWTSTEHCEDIYAVLKYFANNTPAKAATYNAAATSVKSFLDNVVWDNANQRFMGGYKNDTSTIDPNVPMDVNPWGVLALGTSGTHTYSNSVLYVENANGNPGTLANPKYKQTLKYDATNYMTAYDFDWEDDNADSGDGLKGADIWFEGSAFMSTAYALMGNATKADAILTELQKKQSTGNGSTLGGIPYTLFGTNNNYWHMTNLNCISSTAWFVIAAKRYNPFTGLYITVTPPTKVATPTFNPGSRTFTGTLSVSIECATSGATIRYTTNGSTPNASSTAYTGPITISNTTTIKAIAIKSGLTDSDVASATYTKDNSAPIPGQIEAESYSAMNGIQTESCSEGGQNVGWTDAGDWMDYSVNVQTAGNYKVDYRVASANGGGQAKLQIGGTDVSGSTISIGNTGGWQNWTTVTANSVYLNAGTQTIRVYVSAGGFNLNWFKFTSNTQTVETPTFNPAGGTYTSAQNVSINCGTSGATIKYTTDGSTPTSSSATYTSAIAVSSTTTIKAIAIKSGMTDSAVASATYTININNAKTIPGKIEAEAYSTMNGIQTESCSEGGQNVGWTDAGDWMDYTVNVQTAGNYQIVYRVASANGGGQVKIQIGGTDVYGSAANIASTGGWQNWTDVVASCYLNAGTQTIRVYVGTGGFNVNWIQFTKVN